MGTVSYVLIIQVLGRGIAQMLIHAILILGRPSRFLYSPKCLFETNYLLVRH